MLTPTAVLGKESWADFEAVIHSRPSGSNATVMSEPSKERSWTRPDRDVRPSDASPTQRFGWLSWLSSLWRQPADLARRLNASRRRMWYLGVASFLETTAVPVAIELVMVPFMLANRHRLWTIATVTLAGCLAGAILGYLVGWLFFDTMGIWIVESLGQRSTYEAFQERFGQDGFWAIVVIGITPIPFPIAMLAAGATGYPFLLYCVACAIARGVRYYGLAALVALAGPRVLDWLGKGRRAVKVSVAVVALLLGGAVLLYLQP